MAIRIQSVADPFDSADPDAARDAVEAILLADAMGLLDEVEVDRLDLAAMRKLARAAGEVGIGVVPAAVLETGRLDLDDFRSGLRALREALEASPAPSREWSALIPVFGAETLARLVSVSPASLRRYASGTRPTPDAVAARLHFVARVVAALKGAYNDIGVRRWFERKRSALRGRSPAQMLRGEWRPEDPAALTVLGLARALLSSTAT